MLVDCSFRTNGKSHLALCGRSRPPVSCVFSINPKNKGGTRAESSIIDRRAQPRTDSMEPLNPSINQDDNEDKEETGREVGRMWKALEKIYIYVGGAS
ncbi:hypothetical protein RUM44_012318 [Polyplax serrata]|uniref:Uncharacterized protein n=1 Tax=Polyplax serrata TaxID=468196 RepID=A0ABR1BEW2_POLSC